MKPTVTRFAPSPTGFLHIGGARTALFNYVVAKKSGGQFLLRIEDTDKERNTQEAVDAILQGLAWLGLDHDGDLVFQSKRTDRYQEMAESLLKKNRAYYCDCSKDTLDEKRKAAQKAGKKPKYDGHCRERGLTKSNDTVLRFLAPTTGTTTVADLIKGDTRFDNQELDDFVILRADGSPTYNFVVVVDDADMGMTHVLRGDDHLSNTPKQIMLYEALEVPMPSFGHMPLILGSDKTRLSKRHGATAVQNYQAHGFLPDAMNNFLARLGWSKGDSDIFSMDELINSFEISDVGRSPGIFDIDKLRWVNQQYLRKLPHDKATELIKPFLQTGSEYLNSPGWSAQLSESLERCYTLAEFADDAHYFFSDDIDYDEKLADKHLLANAVGLSALKDKIDSLTSYDEASIDVAFKEVLQEHSLKFGQLGPAVRVAITGHTQSPALASLLFIVGKDRCMQRLAAAVSWIEKGTS